MKENKKKIIIISSIIIVLLIGIILGIIVIKNKDDKKLKETDNIKEITPSTSDENREPEQEEPKEDIENNQPNDNEAPEEPTMENNQENNNQQEQETPEENQNSNTSNNTGNNNNNSNSGTSNNNSSNSNNTSSNNNQNNSNQDKEDSTTTTPEVIETVVVNDKSINLSNYSSNIKITEGGTYTIKGTLKYSLYIEANEKVTLNLSGVTIKSKKDAAVANINTNEFEVNLVDGTTTSLTDSGTETDYDATLYSNGPITINGNGTLKINGDRRDCEGIATKNAPITINSGTIVINSIDDGLNTGGDGATISLNGGNVYIKAGGDGVDSNKDIVINGGTHYIMGSSVGADSGLDADAGIVINGGTIISLGSDFLQSPESTSTQNVLALGFNTFRSTNTLYSLLSTTDTEIISLMSKEKFKTIIISSDKLEYGTYNLYNQGSHSGTLNNNIYTGGSYTKGTLLTIDGHSDFTVSDTINIYTEATENTTSEYYEINTSVIGKGSIDVVTSYISGTEIAFAVTPEENYTLQSISITDAEGKEIPYTEDYIFMMPMNNITISAVFTENKSNTTNTNTLSQNINNYFNQQSIITTIIIIISSIVFIICYKNKENQN